MKMLHSTGQVLPGWVLPGWVACTALVGCAVGPDFHRPAAPRDTGYVTSPLPSATSSTDSAAGVAQRLLSGADVPFAWWEQFGNPALNSLVEQAFRANPTIPAAHASLRQAQELVSAQRGLYFPSIGADYGFERQKLAGNLSGSSAPGVQGDGTDIAAVQNAPGSTTYSGSPPYNEPLYYNFHTAQFTVGFVPDVFGANRRKVESLDAQAQLQRFELEATYVTLASNVVGAAIQEASIRAQIAAVQEMIESARQSLTILQDKFRQGYAMRIDVATQESVLAQAQALLPSLQKQLEQTRDQLRALVGQLPNQELAQTFELASLKLPDGLPVSLPSRIIEQRPDVRAAEQQLRSASAQVGIAVAAMLPQFSIAATVGGTATEFSQMFSSGGPFWTLIGDVSQPLFQGGALWHAKRAADQALLQSAAQYQQAVITAYQNVADSLHALLSDADALASAVAAEKAAKVTLDLTRERERDGYTDYLTDLAAEMAYQQAVLTRVQAQANRLTDTAGLYQSLGGGWWNRPQSPDLARE